MAGTLARYAYMDRDELISAIKGLEGSTYLHDVAEVAIRAAHSFNNLQPTGLSDSAFEAVVDAVIGMISVDVPDVPDFEAATDAQLRDAAIAMDTALWAYNRHVNALEYCAQFWRKKAGQSTTPTAQQYRSTFLWMANKSRALRSLPLLS